MSEQETQAMKALAEYDSYVHLVTDDTACVFCGGIVDWRVHASDVILFHFDTCPMTIARGIIAQGRQE